MDCPPKKVTVVEKWPLWRNACSYWRFDCNSKTLSQVKPRLERAPKQIKSQEVPKPPLVLVVLENNHYFS